MENQGKKTIPLKIGINDIKFLHFELTTRVQELKEPLPYNVYEFQFEMQSHIAESEKLMNVQITITLYEKQSAETKIELAKIITLTSFRVVNFDEVITKNNNIINIPNQLIAVAAGIAISTSRGMFVMNVKDTIISNAIIPIINPQDFLPKNT